MWFFLFVDLKFSSRLKSTSMQSTVIHWEGKNKVVIFLFCLFTSCPVCSHYDHHYMMLMFIAIMHYYDDNHFCACGGCLRRGGPCAHDWLLLCGSTVRQSMQSQCRPFLSEIAKLKNCDKLSSTMKVATTVTVRTILFPLVLHALVLDRIIKLCHFLH